MSLTLICYLQYFHKDCTLYVYVNVCKSLYVELIITQVFMSEMYQNIPCHILFNNASNDNFCWEIAFCVVKSKQNISDTFIKI